MNKATNFGVIALAAVLAVLTAGCGSKKCDLTGITVRDVQLEGPDSTAMDAALKAELFSRGVKYSPGGAIVRGTILANEKGIPWEVSAEMESTAFAATASVVEEPHGPFSGDFAGSTERRLAMVLATDFCRCQAHTDADK